MNRQALYMRAQQTVARRRQRAESLAMSQSEEIYAENPELEMLDKAKSEAGVAAAILAAGGQREESQAKLDEMANAEQRRLELLAALGLSPQALEPAWHCKRCQDKGRVNGLVCACVHEEVKRLRREEVNASGPLSLCSFENFDLERYPQTMEGVGVSPRELMRDNLKSCIIYAEEFDLSSDSLYLFGDAGLGKTHLALSIASVVLEQGFDVVYVSVQNAFSRMDEERRGWEGTGEYFRTLLEADLLVLDDLGTEYLDAYIRSRLYELVNTRMHRRPTIYTTNICSQNQLQQRYTEKIASRLLGDCHRMRFIGQDIRLLGV